MRLSRAVLARFWLGFLSLLSGLLLLVTPRRQQGAGDQDISRLTPNVIPRTVSKTNSSNLLNTSVESAFLASFIPAGATRCQDLFPDSQLNVPFDAATKRLQAEFLKQVDNFVVTDGHSGLFPHQYRTLYELARAPFVSHVCETGFNAGHSAFMWLAANPKVTVTSFEFGFHPWSRPLASWLQKAFPGRLTMIWGNSVHTLHQYRWREQGRAHCDLAFVDGGHNHRAAGSDLDQFRMLAGNRSNLVMFDDYPEEGAVFGEVWEAARERGHVIELFRCNDGKHRGFSVGTFRSPTNLK